jgi:hypothetical protein
METTLTLTLTNYRTDVTLEVTENLRNQKITLAPTFPHHVNVIRTMKRKGEIISVETTSTTGFPEKSYRTLMEWAITEDLPLKVTMTF